MSRRLFLAAAPAPLLACLAPQAMAAAVTRSVSVHFVRGSAEWTMDGDPLKDLLTRGLVDPARLVPARAGAEAPVSALTRAAVCPIATQATGGLERLTVELRPELEDAPFNLYRYRRGAGASKPAAFNLAAGGRATLRVIARERGATEDVVEDVRFGGAGELTLGRGVYVLGARTGGGVHALALLVGAGLETCA